MVKLKQKIFIILKIFFLNLKRLATIIFKKIFSNLSYIFLVLSFLILLFFLIPTIFCRVPIFSYLVKTTSLPISYELEGKVVIFDKNNNPVECDIEINVGGYSIFTHSNETFELNFSSPSTDSFYVVIIFTDSSLNQKIVTQRICTNNQFKISEEIIIYE